MEKKTCFFTALCLTAALLFSGCANFAGADSSAPPAESTPDSPSKSLTAPEIPPEEPEPEPTPSGLVPAREEPVDEAYFDDAAFVGNSLVDGFRMFSGLTNCDYYAETSMTIMGIGDYITQMSSVEYGKIYMLLGINEIGYQWDMLIQRYSDALDRLMADHPDALIYIMGLSPVSAGKEASSDVFTMDNIRGFNQRLLQLAEEKGCCYIDLCDALGGEDGYLPSEVTTDGVHFVPSEYQIWRDYLFLHYIPVEEPAPAEG